MKGLFIPEITAEMFRNGCLESIEALMAEGEIYDIEYPLEQEPKTDGDCISRADVIKELQALEQEDIERFGCKIPEGFDAEEAVARIKTLPSVQPVTDGDYISRAEAKEIIAQTDITNGFEPVFTGRQVIALLNDLPPVNPQPKTDSDCISRQAVIERIKREEKILYTPTGMNYLIRVIRDLPSVTPPEPKTDGDYMKKGPIDRQELIDWLFAYDSENYGNWGTIKLDHLLKQIREMPEAIKETEQRETK